MAASNQNDDNVITGINVTPLVDVMLVLLIIFMVTANLITNKAIGVTLPKAETGEEPQVADLRIEVQKDGKILANEQPTSIGAFPATIAALKKDGKAVTVSIAADRAAPHGAVIDAVDGLRKNGIFDFAFTVGPE